MVPLTGGEKGRSVQSRRCPRNCKYPSRSAPAMPGVSHCFHNVGSGKVRNGAARWPRAGAGRVQARRPAIYKSGKPLPCGVGEFWRCLLAGCPASTNAPQGAFSLLHMWQRAGCSCPDREPLCPDQGRGLLEKTHDRATPFAFFGWSSGRCWPARAARVCYVQAGWPRHGLSAGCATARTSARPAGG